MRLQGELERFETSNNVLRLRRKRPLVRGQGRKAAQCWKNQLAERRPSADECARCGRGRWNPHLHKHAGVEVQRISPIGHERDP